MENRSHALIAGLFVVLLLAAAAVLAIWLGQKNVRYEPYELVSKYPVSGLSVQSQVRYQGLAVGQVEALSIDSSEPGVIRVRVGVLPDTPITHGTWAEVATQGVTGISNIDLLDDGRDLRAVATSEADPFVIPVRPGFFQKLQTLGVGMLEDADAVLDDMRLFLSTENAEVFSAMLAQAQQLTAHLNQSVVRLDPAIEALPGLMAQMTHSLSQVDQLSSDMSQLTQLARQTMLTINSPTGPLAAASASLAELQRAVAQLQSTTLPQFNLAAQSISEAARSFTDTARFFEQSPQSVLFGPAPVRPGPGEPGFQGFGKESAD
jgi:phospholipid/cholesterol/gamma-HCH transport system substrate-binding protein